VAAISKTLPWVVECLLASELLNNYALGACTPALGIKVVGRGEIKRVGGED